MRQRVRPQLKVYGEWLHALAAFFQPWRAVAARRPEAAPFPAGFCVVDAAVETFGVKPERVGDAQDYHVAVFHRNQAVVQIAGRHRHVVAETEGVMLVDPRVVASLRAIVADAFKAGTGILIERPALGAMVAGGFRTVERCLAFPPVEASEVA